MTSRDTQRYIIPKGWPKKSLAPHELAAVEALEEAGLAGEIETEPIGEFTYHKDLKHLCHVLVFPLFVTTQLDVWKESDQRHRHWMAADLAAQLVVEPDLADLLIDLEDLV